MFSGVYDAEKGTAFTKSKTSCCLLGLRARAYQYQPIADLKSETDFQVRKKKTLILRVGSTLCIPHQMRNCRQAILRRLFLFSSSGDGNMFGGSRPGPSWESWLSTTLLTQLRVKLSNRLTKWPHCENCIKCTPLWVKNTKLREIWLEQCCMMLKKF